MSFQPSEWVSSLAVDSKLPLHRVGLHLTTGKPLGIVVHIFEIILKFGVSSNGARHLCIELLLIPRPSAELLLSNQLTERELVVVCVVSQEIPLLVSCLELHDELA